MEDNELVSGIVCVCVSVSVGVWEARGGGVQTIYLSNFIY